jgi:hypothetical protein
MIDVLKNASEAFIFINTENNTREYRRGNSKRTIQRNCQHRIHKKKKNKEKT